MSRNMMNSHETNLEQVRNTFGTTQKYLAVEIFKYKVVVQDQAIDLLIPIN